MRRKFLCFPTWRMRCAHCSSAIALRRSRELVHGGAVAETRALPCYSRSATPTSQTDWCSARARGRPRWTTQACRRSTETDNQTKRSEASRSLTFQPNATQNHASRCPPQQRSVGCCKRVLLARSIRYSLCIPARHPDSMGATASAAAAAAPRPKTVLRCVALGDPVTDIVVSVDPKALEYLGAAPGSCVEVRRRRPAAAARRWSAFAPLFAACAALTVLRAAPPLARTPPARAAGARSRRGHHPARRGGAHRCAVAAATRGRRVLASTNPRGVQCARRPAF